MDSAHIAGMFTEAVVAFGPEPAARIWDGENWVVTTYAELGAQERSLAARMIDRGLVAGDRVALFSPNRPEWSLIDLACAYAGLVSVPMYATSTHNRPATSSQTLAPRWSSSPASANGRPSRRSVRTFPR